ncbi:hypothetical protein ACLKA7_007666 [Drosophila subpalustris]
MARSLMNARCTFAELVTITAEVEASANTIVVGPKRPGSHHGYSSWTRSASSSRGCLHHQGYYSETNSFYAYNRLPKLDITPNRLENLMLDRKMLLILQRDWKGAVRKKLAHNRRETSATVGGPYAQLALSDAEQTVATFRCARY